jgi:SSS family solute:Na+ symporter
MLLISVIACLIGTYTAPPVDEEVLKSFYKNVRPWGFWKPIHEKIVAEDPNFEQNKNFGRDMFNVGIGIIWQTALVILPIYLILLDVLPLMITIAITLLTTLILKKNWFDKLPKDK